VSERRIYRCLPSIAWVKDAGQTLVVDRETGQSWALRGVEAVVWDLLSVGYSYRRIVPMLSLILSLSVEEAGRALARVMQEWRHAGILRVSEESNDGQPDRQRDM
jgi:hypothetical protein